MAKSSKVISSGSKQFAAGGKTKMFGKQTVGSKTPGITGKADKNGGGKFAAGGKTRMFGRQAADRRVPGKTGK